MASAPNPFLTGAGLWFTHDEEEQDFTRLGEHDGFPSGTTLQWWTPARNATTWIARVNFSTIYDRQQALSAIDGSDDVWLVTSWRKWRTVDSSMNQHQVSTIWLRLKKDGLSRTITSNVMELEFDQVGFGTESPSSETDAALGNYPVTRAFLGVMDSFYIHRSDSLFFTRTGANHAGDAAQIRRVKLTSIKGAQEQPVWDAMALSYARQNTSMSPDGTFSKPWGERSVDLPELGDLAMGLRALGLPVPDSHLTEELDAAMGRHVEGTATAEDLLLIEETDFILGDRIVNGWQTWGRNTPPPSDPEMLNFSSMGGDSLGSFSLGGGKTPTPD
jgi:hypothetical protein